MQFTAVRYVYNAQIYPKQLNLQLKTILILIIIVGRYFHHRFCKENKNRWTDIKCSTTHWKSSSVRRFPISVDYTKTFDSVNCTRLWSVLKSLGVPLYLIELNLYSNSADLIRLNDVLSKDCKIMRSQRVCPLTTSVESIPSMS